MWLAVTSPNVWNTTIDQPKASPVCVSSSLAIGTPKANALCAKGISWCIQNKHSEEPEAHEWSMPAPGVRMSLWGLLSGCKLCCVARRRHHGRT